ncbi:MAG: ftsX [Paucimonas sp.]|nr:ftsX [Paucimonas sp.]
MSAWLRQHGNAFFDAIRRAGRTWPGFLFNAIVLAAVLALPIGGLTLLDNLLPVTRQLAADPELTIFLAPGAAPARVQAAGAEIRRLALAADPRAAPEFIPRERALAGLKKRTAIGEAVAALGENPLPDAWLVRLRQDGQGQVLEKLATDLRKVEGVDHVQLDADWVRRLAALVRLFHAALLLLALALGTVVVAAVFNTVRLQMLTQRDEIDVCRLCGATDAFVSRPFYYAGALLGMASGALALGAVAAALPWLNRSVGELAMLYGSSFRLAPLGAADCGALLAASILLGCAGAGLSVRRHLARQPG